MKGRKPKLQVVEGGAAVRRAPPPPSWLPAHAKAEWKRVAPRLQARGLLNDEARATLESYCVAVGMVRECEETMVTEGRTVETERGPTVHPAFRIQQGAMREARLLATELSLTPHRQALRGKTDDDTGDGWGDLVDG
ncbi:phage terminase small subunit P27 family [Rhodospira trueperi]|uniref:Phage terminase, small subunit, putative, P27 family n=1 Tax=Rhodospira trueperi TaxID=69960 RepID=A0A1G6X3Q5_9PROT|nr:phage terminase small subunit P27 family [Rhodospira trueperi]SDD71916.1 phage terminase, small subunit, putative, P27 family [Rhodospira trueperi]